MTPEDSTTSGNKSSYKAAGVDIDAGNALVEAIKPLAASTSRSGADAALGGFGGLFDLRAAGYQDPILVAANDGVGTKLKIAITAGRHETIGIDLVAMCVNDLVVQGAEPLFFLDYYATGKLEVSTGREIISGIAEGCRQAGCALIGGETAEMPGLYRPGDYDLAGFSLGAVERGKVLTGSDIRPGDIVLGFSSSGLHSNGFSLVREIISKLGLDYAEEAPFEPERSLSEALLTPTRIYVSPCLKAIRAGTLKALAHITGGGFYENLPRVLPQNTRVVLEGVNWPVPPVFRWLAKAGAIETTEMLRTFNCGIGMAAIAGPEQAEEAKRILSQEGETVRVIGKVEAAGANDEKVLFTATDLG